MRNLKLILLTNLTMISTSQLILASEQRPTLPQLLKKIESKFSHDPEILHQTSAVKATITELSHTLNPLWQLPTTTDSSDQKSSESAPKPTRQELAARLRKKRQEKAQERAAKHYNSSISDATAELQTYAALEPLEAMFYANNRAIVEQVSLKHPELFRQSNRKGQGMDAMRKLIQIAMREHPDKVARE